MSQVVSLPLLDLDHSFPETVFVLHHPSSDRYACFLHQGVHGLACFSTEMGALRFSEWIELGGMVVRQLSFEEAREVAKQRPMPVVAVMMLDSMESPSIHYVR